MGYLGDRAFYRQNAPQQPSDTQRLATRALPVFHHALMLANAAGISLGELRFLSYSASVSQTHHYRRFLIKKHPTGQYRQISAPMPRLKQLQYWVLNHLLQHQALSQATHGFVRQRSILSNAQPHVGRRVVINLDLKDFFPSIGEQRVRGLFRAWGYNHEVATVLSLICTEQPVTEVELDQQRFFLGEGQRHLPQGAPTSPALSNLLCQRLDKRLQGLADRHQMHYTRYADDLSFSGDSTDTLGPFLRTVRRIIEQEGFTLHPDKTRLMHQGRRQEVTGLVVNTQLSIDRRQLKRFRALLFQIEKDGFSGKTWGKAGEPATLSRLKSYAHFVRFVQPSKGEQFLQRLARLEAREKGEHFEPMSSTQAVSHHPLNSPPELGRSTLTPSRSATPPSLAHKAATLAEPLSAPLATQAIPSDPAQAPAGISPAQHSPPAKPSRPSTANANGIGKASATTDNSTEVASGGPLSRLKRFIDSIRRLFR